MKVKENLFELDEAYKRGYAEGVYELRGKLMMQVNDLLIEQKKIQTYCKDDDIYYDEARHEGYIECLKMFQKQLKGDEHE